VVEFLFSHKRQNLTTKFKLPNIDISEFSPFLGTSVRLPVYLQVEAMSPHDFYPQVATNTVKSSVVYPKYNGPLSNLMRYPAFRSEMLGLNTIFSLN